MRSRAKVTARASVSIHSSAVAEALAEPDDALAAPLLEGVFGPSTALRGLPEGVDSFANALVQPLASNVIRAVEGNPNVAAVYESGDVRQTLALAFVASRNSQAPYPTT